MIILRREKWAKSFFKKHNLNRRNLDTQYNSTEEEGGKVTKLAVVTILTDLQPIK